MNAHADTGAQPLAVEVAGETLLLHPDRVVLWPARRTALLADPHFGKDDVFRRRGVPLPGDHARTDLARVAALVAAHALERLVVLGDFFHGAPDPDDAFFAAFARFRDGHPRLAIDVVVGNHDRHGGAGRLGDSLAWHADGLDLGPWACRHEPAPVAGRYVLAGHVHPVIALDGPGRDRARLPAFVFGTDVGVLPSFGSFTGGHCVVPAPGERAYVAVGRRVLALPPRR